MPLPFTECLLSLPSILQILFLLTQLNINILLLGRNSKVKIIKWLSQGQKPVCGLARIWISLWCQCPSRFYCTLSPHLLPVHIYPLYIPDSVPHWCLHRTSSPSDPPLGIWLLWKYNFYCASRNTESDPSVWTRAILFILLTGSSEPMLRDFLLYPHLKRGNTELEPGSENQ